MNNHKRGKHAKCDLCKFHKCKYVCTINPEKHKCDGYCDITYNTISCYNVKSYNCAYYEAVENFTIDKVFNLY